MSIQSLYERWLQRPARDLDYLDSPTFDEFLSVMDTRLSETDWSSVDSYLGFTQDELRVIDAAIEEAFPA